MKKPVPMAGPPPFSLPEDWVWASASEVCERVSVGHVGPTSEHFTDADSGVPFVRSQNVRPGRLTLDSAKYITPEFHGRLRKSQLEAGDVLVVRVGANRGDSCEVPAGIHQLNCANVVFARPIFPNGFLGLFLGSDYGRQSMLSLSTGAAQGVINTGAIAALPVPVPPDVVQRRIASILSAYANLIENNLRRVQILEEMAQALYREWFVEFRFPGHEEAEMSDTARGQIPKGWTPRQVGSAALVVDCSHARKPEQAASDNVLLHVWNVGDHGKLDLSKCYTVSSGDYSDWTKRIEVAGGDCVITKTGRVGAVGQVPQGVQAALGRNLVAIRMKEAPTFLLQYLLSAHKDGEVARLTARGTIMESLHVKAVNQMIVNVPAPSC